TATGNVWHFANAADKPGVPDTCTDLGGGSYECPATACLAVPYTGTCPACSVESPPAPVASCAGSAETGAPVCSIERDTSPAEVAETCASDQFLILRCDAPITAPSGGECVPAKVDGTTPPSAGTLSQVWCCK
ncbi:MAG TPA: hypothetical protein VHW01_14765, partial [Polyangiaceae bacterium]|nr:hypothetical protein [Polyangiaceae bacterium]